MPIVSDSFISAEQLFAHEATLRQAARLLASNENDGTRAALRDAARDYALCAQTIDHLLTASDITGKSKK